MTANAEPAPKALARGSSALAAQLAGLRRAVEASRGRLDEAVVDDAAAVVARLDSRLQLSGEHTVVALAGATGSGKSSTFNALTGLELAATGVRRPTTSWTMSCSWGSTQDSEELLDWLGVPPRHRVTRGSMLDNPDAPDEEQDLAGLVLLDLPDHDSTEVAHHVEVDRLVAMADLLVWVLDPQKYADAAIHDRYLKPLAEHRDVLLVVLNHVDEVPEDRRPAMLEDLERLLETDGLAEVPVIATSARDGLGIEDLQKEISARVRDKKAVTDRGLADVADAARQLEQAFGVTPGPAGSDRGGVPGEAVVDAFVEAVGVPTVVHAVEQSTQRRARQATGWPVTSWLVRLRPDPARQLRASRRGRTVSMPELTEVQRARVDAAVRTVAEQGSQGLPRPWAEAVRAASVSRLPELGNALDHAVTELSLPLRVPWWCRGVQLLQWLLLLTALAGGGWLASLGAGASQQAPTWYGFSVPAALVAGGVLLGLALSLLCRGLVTMSARLRASAARRRLRVAVTEVIEGLVVAPVEAEREAYRTARQGLADALR